MTRIQPATAALNAIVRPEGPQPSGPINPAAARVSLPVLRSMLSTAELDRRPSRPPDLAAENQALIALAQALATAPETMLQKLADTALVLCRAHSAGLTFWRSRIKRDGSTGVPLPENGLLTEVEERRANLAHAARSWIAIPPCSVRILSAIFPISAKLPPCWKKLC